MAAPGVGYQTAKVDNSKAVLLNRYHVVRPQLQTRLIYLNQATDNGFIVWLEPAK